MHGTTFVYYSRFAVATNLRGRGLSQSSCSCYSGTAPFQDGKQSQMHLHGFSSAIATKETSPGLGGYATCRFLVLADGLCVCEAQTTKTNRHSIHYVTLAVSLIFIPDAPDAPPVCPFCPSSLPPLLLLTFCRLLSFVAPPSDALRFTLTSNVPTDNTPTRFTSPKSH